MLELFAARILVLPLFQSLELDGSLIFPSSPVLEDGQIK